ncbi:hypothetical protein WS76_29230 [Burkholderia humptydooensis]|nr:hypothetical protein WS76_29230 [Burkholderia humptydooensis]
MPRLIVFSGVEAFSSRNGCSSRAMYLSSSASSIATVSTSGTPSYRAGRKCIWNAAIASVVRKSSAPVCGVS